MIDVILFLECHRILAKKGPPPTPPKRKCPSARTSYQHRLAEWRKDQYVAPTQFALKGKRLLGF
jgi:hypothetical protein